MRNSAGPLCSHQRPVDRRVFCSPTNKAWPRENAQVRDICRFVVPFADPEARARKVGAYQFSCRPLFPGMDLCLPRILPKLGTSWQSRSGQTMNKDKVDSTPRDGPELNPFQFPIPPLPPHLLRVQYRKFDSWRKLTKCLG